MRIKLLIVIGLVLVSCKKEISSGKWGHSPDCDDVFDTTIDGGVGDINYMEDSIQFKYPTFNPDNSDEILYQYINYNTLTFQLKKYNIKTRLNQVLVDNVILINQPAWSKNGKIVYEVYGNELFLTDEFGTEPIPFGYYGLNRKPSCFGMEEKFVFRHTNFLNGEHYVLCISADQENTDTLMYPAAGTDNIVISRDKFLLASSGDNFYALDLKTKDSFSYQDMVQIPLQLGGGGAQGLCWSADGTKFYASKYSGGSTTPSGLYEVEYPSGNYRRIVTYCASKTYTKIAASPDGKFLLVQRLDRYQKFNSNGGFTGDIVENSSIYMFNPATGMEIKLDLE